MSDSAPSRAKSASSDNPAEDLLVNMAQQFNEETSPLRGEFIGQLMEAITTGGAGAQIPLISKATEQSRLATSQAMKQVDERLAASGLSGTPFGEQTAAQTLLSGELATANIAPNMAMQFIQMIPNFILGLGQTAASAGAGAAGPEATRESAMIDSATRFTAGK